MKKLIILMTALFLTACQTSDVTENNDVTIYTTVYPNTFIANELVGEFATVESVLPTGSNAHTYELTQKQIIDVAEADLFFYVSDELEAFAGELDTLLNSEKVKIVAVEDHVEFLEFEEREHEHETDHEDHDEEADHEDHDEEADHEDHDEEAGQDDHEEETDHDEDDDHVGHVHMFDPHVWVDPYKMIEVTNMMADEFIKIMPEHSEAIEENRDSVIAELNALGKSYDDAMTDVERDAFIITHQSFYYIEVRYGLHALPIFGSGHDSEPSQTDLLEIIDSAKEEGIKYILIEQNVSSQTIEVLSDELGAEIIEISNLATNQTEDDNYYEDIKKHIEIFNRILH
jgi:zinc transport system substrate-binding protein